MEKSALIKSADKIEKVSEDSLKEYVDKRDLLVAKMNEIMLNRKDILELIGGENNVSKMKANHANHLRFAAAILQTPDSKTLVDTLLWVFRSFMSRGFTSKYWEVQMNILIQLLKENLSKRAFYEILSIHNWINVNIPNFTIYANSELEKSKYMDNE